MKPHIILANYFQNPLIGARQNPHQVLHLVDKRLFFQIRIQLWRAQVFTHHHQTPSQWKTSCFRHQQKQKIKTKTQKILKESIQAHTLCHQYQYMQSVLFVVLSLLIASIYQLFIKEQNKRKSVLAWNKRLILLILISNIFGICCIMMVSIIMVTMEWDQDAYNIALVPYYLSAIFYSSAKLFFGMFLSLSCIHCVFKIRQCLHCQKQL